MPLYKSKILQNRHRAPANAANSSAVRGNTSRAGAGLGANSSSSSSSTSRHHVSATPQTQNQNPSQTSQSLHSSTPQVANISKSEKASEPRRNELEENEDVLEEVMASTPPPPKRKTASKSKSTRSSSPPPPATSTTTSATTSGGKRKSSKKPQDGDGGVMEVEVAVPPVESTNDGKKRRLSGPKSKQKGRQPSIEMEVDDDDDDESLQVPAIPGTSRDGRVGGGRGRTSASPEPEKPRGKRFFRWGEGEDSNFLMESSTEDEEDEEEEEMPYRAAANTETTSISSQSMDTSAFTGASMYNPHDPEWLRFCDNVRDHPDSVGDQLIRDLVDAGTGGSALLGKLIYRTLNGRNEEGETQESAHEDEHEKYSAIILQAILTATLRHDNNSENIVDLVNMIFVELRHFTTDVLYSIVEGCLKYLKNDKDRDGYLPPRWIQILGQMVSVLVGRGNIKHELDVINGRAYKQFVVNEICRLKWSTENSASLIAIFRHLPELDDTDIKTILFQVRACVQNFRAAAFPPIVSQLISLIGNKCPLELLSICSEYFGRVDLTDTSSLEVRQKRNALGTVVFHFLEAARHSGALLKAALKIIKASCFDFGMVMNPFILSIVLGLTKYEHCHDVIVDNLKIAVVRSFHSTSLGRMSYWYDMACGRDEDTVMKTFTVVLKSNASEVEFMFGGIRELGLSLLNCESLQNKYPNTLEKCRKLGTYLLTSLVKISSEELPGTMKQLLKNTSSKSSANIECLATCLQMRTRQIIAPSAIGRACEIIRHLPMMDSTSAAMLVRAMSTALQLSYTLMDTLMVILRKTVWKSVEARRTAARVMVILLSNAKVVGDVPFSQYSESQRFYCTESASQVNPMQLPDSQPLCLEILSLTKRCFSHQNEIREELYLGFHSVVRKNPALCELVCNQILAHAKQYILLPEEEGEDNDVTVSGECKLRLNEIVEIMPQPTSTPVIIKEELGFLVQCMAFVVMQSYKAFHRIDDGPPVAVSQLEELVRQMIKAILSMGADGIEIVAAEVMSNAGGTHSLDTVRYVENVLNIQIMQAIEASIEYLSLGKNDKDARAVKKLLEMYNTILENSQKKEKAPKPKAKGKKGKESKADKENTLNDTDSVISDASGSQAGAARFKKPDAPKKLVYFHIMNLESVAEMLKILYSVDSNKGPLQQVYLNPEFEKLLLSVAGKKLVKFIKKEPIHERNRDNEKVLKIFADIAGAIWNGLSGQSSGTDESPEIEVTEMLKSRLEVVNDITKHICSLESTVNDYIIHLFGDVSEDEDAPSYDQAFPKFFNSWKALHGWIPLTGESDVHQLLFDILTHFAMPLSPDTREVTNSSQVSNWLWNYISNSGDKPVPADFQLADSVVTCWLIYMMKGKGFLEQPTGSQQDVLTLAKAVRVELGDNEQASERNTEANFTPVKPWIINEETAGTILNILMYHVETRIGHVAALLGKLKFHPFDNEIATKKAAEIRESCFNMMIQIIKVCLELIVTLIPAGSSSTTMLKVVPQVFDVLSGFAEYFMELSKTKLHYSIKGFAAPVNLISKDFQSAVEGMVDLIEKVQRNHAETIMAQHAAKKTKGKAGPSNAIKQQLSLEKKLIPGVIYSIEKYDQQILVLSKALEKKGKKGVFLRVGMKLSNIHDFKINHKKVGEALKKNAGPRLVRDMSTVPDGDDDADETRAGNRTRPVRAKDAKKGKGRKRKPESDEQEEEVEEIDLST